MKTILFLLLMTGVCFANSPTCDDGYVWGGFINDKFVEHIDGDEPQFGCVKIQRALDLEQTYYNSYGDYEFKKLQSHVDILAKMVQQEQYQIDVLTEYIKERK